MSGKTVTHRCDGMKSEFGGSRDRRVPCDGVRYSDGTGAGGCEDPCSWIMGKSGYGEPPWPSNPDGTRFCPWRPDSHE